MTQSLKDKTQILFEYSPVIEQYSDKDIYRTQNYAGFDSYDEFRNKVYEIVSSINNPGTTLSENKNTSASSYHPLKKGDRGEEVVRLQNRLNELGYSVGTADGDFGNKTKVAVETFQQDHGLEVTGIVDEETFNSLFSDKK